MTWRDIARPIIARVISEVGTEDMKLLRAALREAYPFGERRYHPYRIWCHEVRVQLGRTPIPRRRSSLEPLRPCNGQKNIWEDGLE